MARELTIKERLAKIETILQGEIRHELMLHRWLISLMLTLAVVIIAKLLVG